VPPGANPYATARGGVVPRLAGRLAAVARARRYRRFVEATGLRPGDRVVDVGCGSLGLQALDSEHDITGIDQLDQPAYAEAGATFVRGSALEMPFADGEFDVAYCNSLIEHVAREERPRLASEVRRVARVFFVQTPNRWFPVEPHVLLPFFQFLPERLQRRLWRHGASGEPFHRIDLLDRAEMQALFPDAEILPERVGPLVKSWMAVGPRE